MTSHASRINTFHGGWLAILQRYGRYYLDRDAFRRRWRRAVRRYAVFLAKAVVQGKFRDPAFRAHHRETTAMVWRSLRGGDEALPVGETVEPSRTAAGE